MDNRRVTRSIDDWPPSAKRFVKVERDRLPVLDAPGLASPNWTVLAVAHRGEVLQFLAETMIIQVPNPFGREPDGSGTWFKVHLLDGREGWLFARPSGQGVPSLATIVRRPIPWYFSWQVLAAGSLVTTLLIVAAFYRALSKPPAPRFESSDDSGSGGYFGATSGETDGEEEQAPASGGANETGKCPDCNSVKIKLFGEEEGDGVCSACQGRGVGGFMDELADGMNPSGRGHIKCSNCGGSGECPTCGSTGRV
jgi:hypothetical protein